MQSVGSKPRRGPRHSHSHRPIFYCRAPVPATGRIQSCDESCDYPLDNAPKPVFGEQGAKMRDFITAGYSENQKRILRFIGENPGATRHYLARRAELSGLTVNRIIAGFISDGVVVEQGTIESKQGRKPSALAINPDYGRIIGIDIGGYSVEIGLLSLTGEIVDKEDLIYHAKEFPATILMPDEMMEKVAALRDRHAGENILGIGFGISGLVDHNEGRVVYCPNIRGFDNFAVRDFLEERFDLPVFVNTSARCMALAEQRIGSGVDYANQIFVSLGYSSIAAGIIINGELFSGAGGFSGEVGHLTSSSSWGVQCTCGNYDCLETHATLPVIIERISRDLLQPNVYSVAKTMVDDPANIDVDIINRALDDGDKVIYTALDEIGTEIGDILTGLVNILNPETIILGGGVIQSFPTLMEPITRTLKQKALITNQRILKVQKSALGIDCGLIGSAVQVINRFFQ